MGMRDHSGRAIHMFERDSGDSEIRGQIQMIFCARHSRKELAAMKS